LYQNSSIKVTPGNTLSNFYTEQLSKHYHRSSKNLLCSVQLVNLHEIDHSLHGNHGLIISSEFTKGANNWRPRLLQVTFLSHLSGTSRMTSSSPYKVMPLSRESSQISDKKCNLRLCAAQSISQSPTIHRQNTPIISPEI
jgi:hypothetical protein